MPHAKQRQGKEKKRVRGDLDEESQLESRLFGKQKHSRIPAPDTHFDEEGGLGWLQDDEVRP